MAVENLSHNPVLPERVEIDTSLPFQSVKAAVSMFGEKVNVRRLQTVEKPSVKSLEVHQLQEELAAVKHQLAEAEEAKVKAHEELRGTRKLLEEMTQGYGGDPHTLKQSQTCDIFPAPKMQEDTPNGGCSPYPPQDSPFPEQISKNTSFLDRSEQSITEQSNNNNQCLDGTYQDKPSRDALKQSNPNAEEKHVVWEVELKVAQEQHMNAVAELESVKKDLERVKTELVASLREKENAFRQAEEALMAAELNAKRVEELTHEMSGTNESLVLVKLACIEASKERAALLAAKGCTSSHLPSASEHSMVMVEELEMKLAVATKELTRLQQELTLAKEAEVRVTSAASEAYANLALAKRELEEMRMQASIVSGSSSGTHSPELKAKKHELEKALENGASLQATLDALQGELATMRMELASLRDREAVASAAVATLTAELSRTKEDLASAIAAEIKANEAVTVLTQTLQQIRVEADEAKGNMEILKGEATKARMDAEYAKSALATAEREMQIAMEAAQAAKAAEKEAVERLKALSENMSEIQSSVKGTGGVSISQDEYEQLKRRARETEDLANMRIAAANAQVEVAKKSEMELQEKMKALSDDIDAMRNNTEQALRRAEMAESAKRVVECEMRKWREHGKGHERGLVKTERDRERGIERENTSSQLVVVGGGRGQHLCYSALQPPESLAQVLNMKMPSLASDARTLSDRSLGQKKKKHYILPTLNIFSSKKSQALAGSVVGT